MRAVVQRVNFATLRIDGRVFSRIDKGLLVFVGVSNQDEDADCDYIAKKIAKIRIFEEGDKMNADITSVRDGKILIVSQFTLFGDMRGGNRPSFVESAKGEVAKSQYEKVVELVKGYGLLVETGEFGADMKINLENDGPVTIMLDSKKAF